MDGMRELVSRLPNLRVLKLCAVADDTLTSAARCRCLEVFWARYGDAVTDNGMLTLVKVCAVCWVL